jgi:hypothetical protein
VTSLIWNGATGSWFDAANWTPAQVPQSGDSATVTRGSIQLTSNPSDGVTLNLDAISSPNTILDARNVTLGSHFTIVADGVNDVAITGSVVDQGQISVPKALGLLGHSASDLFTNQATINIHGGMLSAVVNFTNSGQINVSSAGPLFGHLDIGQAFTGTGSVSLSNGGGVQVSGGGSVGSGQTFIFQDGITNGIPDQLTINPSTFDATISGFQIGDLINVMTVADSETYDPGSHLLSLFSNGQPAGKLIVAGPLSYTTQSFMLHPGPPPLGETTITTNVSPASVPEPASLALVTTALAFLILVCRLWRH